MSSINFKSKYSFYSLCEFWNCFIKYNFKLKQFKQRINEIYQLIIGANICKYHINYSIVIHMVLIAIIRNCGAKFPMKNVSLSVLKHTVIFHLFSLLSLITQMKGVSKEKSFVLFLAKIKRVYISMLFSSVLLFTIYYIII